VHDEHYKPSFVSSAFEHPEWPVITNKDPSKISLLRWGLIPGWVKDAEMAKKLKVQTVNARRETLHEKPSFRMSYSKKRCIILADGFFEFHELSGKKYPHYIRFRDDKLFTIAGLFDQWVDLSTGEMVESFSLITTEANPLMEKIHNSKKRMPLILSASDQSRWLDDTLYTGVGLLPYPDDEMEAYPVSRHITARGVDRNTPEAIKQVQYPELSISENLFSGLL